MTEFGICEPDGRNTSTDTVGKQQSIQCSCMGKILDLVFHVYFILFISTECEFIMKEADKLLLSWSYWDQEFFTPDGHINWPLVRAFSRPYARAIQGHATKMTFDPRSRRFRLEYMANGAINAPTEIFIPAVQYDNGFTTSSSSNLRKTRSSASSLAYFVLKTNGLDSAWIEVLPL